MEQESPPGYLAILVHGPEYANSEDEFNRFKSIPQKDLDQLYDYALNFRKGCKHPNDSICLWFDDATRQCRNYDLRPDVCREVLKVNDEACHHWRKVYPPMENMK